MISIFYDAVVGVGKVKNSNLSAMLKENTLLGIKTYLWCVSVKKTFSETFLTYFLIVDVSCKFGRIMSCRSSEFMENVFLSLKNSYKFRMLASRITASLKTESIYARLFLTIGVSTE